MQASSRHRHTRRGGWRHARETQLGFQKGDHFQRSDRGFTQRVARVAASFAVETQSEADSLHWCLNPMPEVDTLWLSMPKGYIFLVTDCVASRKTIY